MKFATGASGGAPESHETSNHTPSDWRPGLLFFCKRSASFLDPDDHQKRTATWTYTRIQSPGLPALYMKCSLCIDGVPATDGFSMGWNIAYTLKVSLAEAWERYWMMRIAKSDAGGRGSLTSSNGFAAGMNATEAIRSAREEVAERKILVEAWQSQSGWTEVRVKGLLSHMVIGFLAHHGWRVRVFYVCKAGIGAIVTGLAEHPDFGCAFDSTFLHWPTINCKTHAVITPEKELRVVKSILKSTAFRAKVRPDSTFELPVSGSPEDHARFYSMPSNAAAFAFLDRRSPTAGELPVDRDQARLANVSIDEFICELLFPGAHLPAVARAYHPEWDPLIWGKKSIAGENQWPHPLA